MRRCLGSPHRRLRVAGSGDWLPARRSATVPCLLAQATQLAVATCSVQLGPAYAGGCRLRFALCACGRPWLPSGIVVAGSFQRKVGNKLLQAIWGADSRGCRPSAAGSIRRAFALEWLTSSTRLGVYLTAGPPTFGSVHVIGVGARRTIRPHPVNVPLVLHRAAIGTISWQWQFGYF